jgi:hypothetical protein
MELLKHVQKENEKNTFIHDNLEKKIQADISLRLVLTFGLDLFTESADLTLPPGVSNFESIVKFWDHQNRPLFLNAKVTSHYGGAVKVAIYSQFWIVNKTG